MTESAEQTSINADVQAETTAVNLDHSELEAALTALKDQIASNPVLPAVALDLSKFDALVAGTQASATADAPATVTPPAPPAGTTPTTSAPVADPTLAGPTTQPTDTGTPSPASPTT